MTIKELVEKLGIDNYDGVSNKDTGSYVIELDTYEDFGRVFSKLEKSDIAKEMPDTSIINTHNTDVRYVVESKDENPEYIISLLGDLDEDSYKVVIDKMN